MIRCLVNGFVASKSHLLVSESRSVRKTWNACLTIKVLVLKPRILISKELEPSHLW